MSSDKVYKQAVSNAWEQIEENEKEKLIKYENNPKEFLSRLSDEEFRQLLLRAGFAVEDGKGDIIFTDNINNQKRSALKSENDI